MLKKEPRRRYLSLFLGDFCEGLGSSCYYVACFVFLFLDKSFWFNLCFWFACDFVRLWEMFVNIQMYLLTESFLFVYPHFKICIVLTFMFCQSLPLSMIFICYVYVTVFYLLPIQMCISNEIALHLIHGHSGGTCTGGMWLLHLEESLE